MPNIHQHFPDGPSFMMWFGEQRAKNGKLGGYDGRPSPKVEVGAAALLNGDETHVEQAAALVDRITTQVEAPKNEWIRSVHGYFPDMEAYIRGEPENMWMMRTTKEDHTPIKVYFGLTSSAMIDEDTLITRGCALAAFTIAMANVRPVVIVPFVTLGSIEYSMRRGEARPDPRNMLISWEINTQPLILSELLAITLPEVTRYVGIEACQQLFGKAATRDPGFHRDSFNEQKMRQHLNARPADLYLPCIYGLDPLVNDPVTWVNEMIAHFTSDEATDLTNQPKEGEY